MNKHQVEHGVPDDIHGRGELHQTGEKNFC